MSGAALRQAQGPSLLVNRTTDGEVELAMVVARGTVNVVEAVAPVEAEQAEHRQIDAHAETCRSFYIEWVKVVEPEPAVARLQEGKGIDGSLRIQGERITHLQGVFRHYVAAIATRSRIAV